MITKQQRDEQGAVFTINPAALIDHERAGGFTSNPDVKYVEDSVGSGNLAIALFDALFVDLATKIPCEATRARHIITSCIFMHDIDQVFVVRASERLLTHARQYDPLLPSSAINATVQDTTDVEFSPSLVWGFSYYRTITNRSYSQVCDLIDVSMRTRIRETYQKAIFPDNALSGKKFKIADVCLYKTIMDPAWTGGTDIRPRHVPKTLQTDTIRAIDFRNSVRKMFSSDTTAQGAGIDVVILHYGVTGLSDEKVRVWYGENQCQTFETPSAAWTFYETLSTHSNVTTQTTTLFEQIANQHSTIDQLCTVVTSGVTLGNKRELCGTSTWRDMLVTRHNLEQEAFVPWVDPSDITLMSVAPSKFALLPYSSHQRALHFYMSHMPRGSSHAVPAERKALPKWKQQNHPLLYMRHNAQFTASRQALCVGVASTFVGVGQTGSVMLLIPHHRDLQNAKLIAAWMNSLVGQFLLLHVGRQHKESPSMLQVGARIGALPIPALLPPLHNFSQQSIDNWAWIISGVSAESRVQIERHMELVLSGTIASDR